MFLRQEMAGKWRCPKTRDLNNPPKIVFFRRESMVWAKHWHRSSHSPVLLPQKINRSHSISLVNSVHPSVPFQGLVNVLFGGFWTSLSSICWWLYPQ
jgi:hypothetical protein